MKSEKDIKAKIKKLEKLMDKFFGKPFYYKRRIIKLQIEELEWMLR